jgi:2-dehydro-3-deoxyglucarate aldolase
MQIPNTSVAEIMGQAGYEWVVVDMEHGAIGHNQLPDIFRALELGGTLPLARIAEGQAKDCKQALDAGAGGIIVPMIESAQQLREIREYCSWPPSGLRGVGFSRANLFGKRFGEYSVEAQSPILIAMIENMAAVEDLESILKVGGLDAILVGPYDLSASLGLTGQFDHVKFKGLIKKIGEMARAASISAGFHVVEPSHDEVNDRISEGYRFLAYSIDAVMLRKTVEDRPTVK